MPLFLSSFCSKLC